MPITILFSGGKDSTATAWYYLEQGWDVRCLSSLIPENPDSFMFQTPNQSLLHAQAASLQLPLLVQPTKGEKEKELDDLKTLLKRAKDEYYIDGVAVGAVASEYQHERVTRICAELNLKTFAPLWHKEQDRLLSDMIQAGFDIRMTKIAADGLTKEWLGKKLDMKDLEKLKALNKTNGLHVGGEGGEYETIVLDGPIFTMPISIQFEVTMESAHSGELTQISFVAAR
jgi:asparagine synthase (glutamine-hydrolysing)